MSSPLLHPRHLNIDETFHPYLVLIFQSVTLVCITTAVMDIAYIRHRWRVVLLVARLSGLVAGLMYISWPQPVLVLPLFWSFNFGFVDPRLHLASIKRSPEHDFFKVVDMLGALLHHTGATLVAGMLLQELAVLHDTQIMMAAGTIGLGNSLIHSPPRPITVFSLPVPLIVTLIAEMVDMVVDVAVLLRSAPRWFNCVGPVMMTLQALCLLATMLWIRTPLPPVYVYTVAAGNLLIVLRLSVMKASASTHEVFEPEGREKRSKSVARMIFDSDKIHLKDPALQAEFLKGVTHNKEREHSTSILAQQQDIEAKQMERISCKDFNPDSDNGDDSAV